MGLRSSFFRLQGRPATQAGWQVSVRPTARIRRISRATLVCALLLAACQSGGGSRGIGDSPPHRGEVRIRRVPLRQQVVASASRRNGVWVLTANGDVLRTAHWGFVRVRRVGLGASSVVVAERAVWVAGGHGSTGFVRAFDLATGNTVQGITFPADRPKGLGVGPGGIFTILSRRFLARIHPGGDELTRLRIARGLSHVVVTGREVWVSQPNRGVVWRVEVRPGNMDVAGHVSVRRQDTDDACPSALSVRNTDLWVVDRCSGRIWLIDRESARISHYIKHDYGLPFEMSAAGTVVWVLSSPGTVLTAIDPHDYAVISTTRIGFRASVLAAIPSGAWIFPQEGGGSAFVRVTRHSGSRQGGQVNDPDG